MSSTSPFGRLLLPIYLPSLILAISHQAFLILLPLYVLQIGGSAPLAAVIVAFRGLGMLLGDVPSGLLVSRLGHRPVMLGGIVCLGATPVATALGGPIGTLIPIGALAGIGFSAWMMARLSYMADTCPTAQRGRAMTVIGGMTRAGSFIGPAIGGVLAEYFGYRLAFCACGAAAGVGIVLVLIFTHNIRPPLPVEGTHSSQLREVVRVHRRIFVTAGSFAVSLQSVRSARQVLIPLFGSAAGLDVAAIGSIYSLSAAVDMSLFYPVGVIVDRWGRKYAGIPAMALFSVSLFLLPLAQGFNSFLFVALLLGLANGLSTGLVMILGADLSPPDRKGEFLGVWRLIGDVGHSGGPLIIGALAKAAGLAMATFAMGGLGLFGLFILVCYVDETLKFPRASVGDS